MHAYLIIAYNNFDFLKRLIGLLDDERNDIFIHIDAKAKDFDESYFNGAVAFSSVTFIPRRKVFWADFSLTRAELDLLAAACEKKHYDYYHLLSGNDLPLKSQDEIHAFFDGKTDEFIGICPNEVPYSVNHIKYYHLFTGNSLYRRFKPLKALNLALTKAQALLGINRLKNVDMKIIDGWEWFSITDDFARYIIENRAFIERVFSKSVASDELVFQTMIFNNSDFYGRVYDTENLVRGSLRYIDWKRGRPYTFRSGDYDELIGAEDVLFARKFDPSVDSEIIDRICAYVKERDS